MVKTGSRIAAISRRTFNLRFVTAPQLVGARISLARHPRPSAENRQAGATEAAGARV